MGMSPLDLAAMAPVAGGVTGSVLGGLAGGGGGSSQPDIGSQITQMVNTQNGILYQYLQKANAEAANYTNTGVKDINSGMTNATNALNAGLTGATTQANNNAQAGLNAYAATIKPYEMAGGNAMDKLSDSLGITRPTVGTFAVQNALQNQAESQRQITALGKAPTVGTAPTAPTAPLTLQDYLSMVDTPGNPSSMSYVQSHNVDQGDGRGFLYTGPGGSFTDMSNGTVGTVGAPLPPGVTGGMSNAQIAAQNAAILASGRQGAAQDMLTAANNQYTKQNTTYQSNLKSYNSALDAYNTYQGQYGAAQGLISDPTTQSILAAFNSGKIT